MIRAMASELATFEWLMTFNHWGTIGFVLGLLIQVIVVFRVIMGKRGVGETLAWVMLILGIPVVGWIMYLLIGELRLGASREKRYQQLSKAIQQRLQALEPIEAQVSWADVDQEYARIAQTGRGTLSFPILPGNQLELIEDWQLVFDQIIADIDSAKTNCDLQFYIWHSGEELKRWSKRLSERDRAACTVESWWTRWVAGSFCTVTRRSDSLLLEHRCARLCQAACGVCLSFDMT